jgi:SAM-dependent methyltransferase
MSEASMDRGEWEGRVGRKWAEEWRRTDRSFAGLTDRLLARASARPLARVLDVGCGAGETTLALARGHPNAQFTGLDISEQLIEVARERAAHLANATFLVADAGSWRVSQFAPDLIVSRHGVMFFNDPVAAFANLAKGAAPDARLVFSCFRDRSENPWAERVAALLPEGSVEQPAPDAPGPFAFADRYRVQGILETAGWQEVSFEAVDFAYVAGTGEDAVDDAVSYFQSIGPAARAIIGLDETARAAFSEKLRRYLSANAQGPLVALPGAAWIVAARTR